MSFYLLYTINIPKKNEKGKKTGPKDVYRRKNKQDTGPEDKGNLRCHDTGKTRTFRPGFHFSLSLSGYFFPPTESRLLTLYEAMTQSWTIAFSSGSLAPSTKAKLMTAFGEFSISISLKPKYLIPRALAL